MKTPRQQHPALTTHSSFLVFFWLFEAAFSPVREADHLCKIRQLENALYWRFANWMNQISEVKPERFRCGARLMHALTASVEKKENTHVSPY